MKIAIVGGGPGGLYFARLIKTARPDHDVSVFEQNARGATFGFGVGLGGSARERIRAVDPELHDAITGAMIFSSRQTIRLNDTAIELDYAEAGGSIERLNLLDILQSACAVSNVRMQHGQRITTAADLSGYDLIVGADGVNSSVRQMQGGGFGTRSYNLTNHFAWYGVGRAMHPAALVFRETGLGRFVGHYYAYTETMSTFVAECDDSTWNKSRMDAMDDNQRRACIEQIFAPELQGSPLIDKNSVWRTFPVITNARWHLGNCVLIGDALLSAHFSIGSGTRLAMDDAAALFEAVRDHADVGAALAAFEQQRRPVRERFRLAAEKSFNWYERLADTMQQKPVDFVHDFLTRTGRIDDARLAGYCPGFYALYKSETAGRAGAARHGNG